MLYDILARNSQMWKAIKTDSFRPISQIQDAQREFVGAFYCIMQYITRVPRMPREYDQKIAIIHHCAICSNDGDAPRNSSFKRIVAAVKTGRKG